MAADEAARLGAKSKPLESEPWTRQRGEIDPQGEERNKPSKTCETPGTEMAVGVGDHGADAPAEVAMRETPNPKEGIRPRGTGGSRTEDSEEARSSRGDETVAQAMADVSRKRP